MRGHRMLGALLGAAILGAGAAPARGQEVPGTISGTLQVGTSAGRQGGCAGDEVWLRDGVLIPGASKGTYTLTAADLGHHITARATCTASGNTFDVTSTGIVTTAAPELPAIGWAPAPPSGGNLYYAAQSSVLGDPTDPGIVLDVGQLGADNATPVDPSQLQVSVAVQPNGKDFVPIDAAGVEIIGSGSTRRVVFHPTRQGIAKLVFTVTGTTGKTATFALDYFASLATTPTSRVLQMSSDPSTAIGVGGGYIMVADDERGPVGLYDQNTSGAPTAYFNVGAGAGEVDFESSARKGDAVFWLGSHGNSKKGEVEASRHTVYESLLEGSGANATLTAVGSYGNLRTDLLAWDQAHGNRYGMVAGASVGNAPDGVDRFNIEGAEFSPDGSELYLGFRAPLTPRVAGGKALIVPVENIQALTRGEATKARFGEPIELALGGHSIREIRRNDAGEYLILSGDGVPNARSVDQALWYWDGRRETAPQRLTTELPHDIEPCGSQTGAWEGIGELPDHLEPGAQVRLIMDQGYDCMYAPPNLPGQPVLDGTRTENKDVSQELVRKARTDTVTLSGALGYEAAIRPPAAFVDQLVGTVSEPRQVTVTNAGTKPLVLGGVSVVDEDGRSAAEFPLAEGSCENATLAAGASCAIDVRFAPTLAGAASRAQLVVEGNVLGGRATAVLTGNSVAPPEAPGDDPDPGNGSDPGENPLVPDPPVLGAPLPNPPPQGGVGTQPAQTTLSVRAAVSVTALKGRKLQIAVTAKGVSKSQLSQRLTVRVKGVKRAFSVRLRQGRATISLGRGVRTGRPASVTVSLPAFTVTSGTTTYQAAKATKTVRVTVRR